MLGFRWNLKTGRPCRERSIVPIVVVAVAAMIGAKLILGVVFFALVFSLHSLKFCLNCKLLPGREDTLAKCKDDDERYESKESLNSAGWPLYVYYSALPYLGFLSPSTLHTIELQHANGDVNCWAACSLGLRHNCSEPGRRECPTVLCTPAKPEVAFEDLAEGQYTVTVNCDESGTCYAEPQKFDFLVQQQTPKSGVSLREIPLVNIKLYKKFAGRCSNEKVWRSRITCFALLETLMGVVFLLISLRERIEDETMPPSMLEDIKWVLQAQSRS